MSFTAEHRQKLSEAQKRLWRSGFYGKNRDEKISKTMKVKGLKPQKWGKWTHPNGMKGKKHSVETKALMSKVRRVLDPSRLKYSTIRKMEMARSEYKAWRKSVFERDNYTCQICNARGVKIHADHIIPWVASVERRYDIENGRTLCVECHKKTDTFSRSKKIREYVR